MPLFCGLLRAALEAGCRFVRMEELADQFLTADDPPPVCNFAMAEIDGRSGTVAVQA